MILSKYLYYKQSTMAKYSHGLVCLGLQGKRKGNFSQVKRTWLEGSHLENSNKPTIHNQIKKPSFLIIVCYSYVKSLTYLDLNKP